MTTIKVLPQRPLRQCRYWLCQKSGTPYCSLDHDELSRVDESVQKAAVIVDGLSYQEKAKISEKVLSIMYAKGIMNRCGIPILDFQVLLQEPWNTYEFDFALLHKETARDLLFISKNIEPEPMWIKFSEEPMRGTTLTLYNTERQHPYKGCFGLQKFTGCDCCAVRYSGTDSALYCLSYKEAEEGQEEGQGITSTTVYQLEGEDIAVRESRTGIPSKTSEIWLLGVCYKISEEEAHASRVLAAFRQDFSSLLLMTHRRGFEPIGDTAYTSDVNWGCMLRSSQMLFAQALLFQRLGRSWRKKVTKPEEGYLEILESFGDSVASAYSIHNLISAGHSYGLAAGSWVGPYDICRSWESLARSLKIREEADVKHHSCSMAVHIVRGSEDGEKGRIPILCIEDVRKSCLECSGGVVEWRPILLLVQLVLGVGNLNPRYIPPLIATFTFPQSLGILGGKPCAPTYIVGVQEDKGFYLDPHNVQQAVTVNKEDQDVDTSSYHCNTLRYVSLELLDPALALGFYCTSEADFEDFVDRAKKLYRDNQDAPLFTVTD